MTESTIECECPTCKSLHLADENDIGRTYICPSCQTECIIPSARISPGMIFGKYQVRRPLGAGSTSEVHLAVDQVQGREVALKILFVEEADAEVDIKRFFREIRNTKSLQHPNLLEIYDTGESNGLYFLAMEYVEGETLDSMLDDHGELPENEALEIMLCVASALEYAWDEKRLVHRDIKPGNIILAYGGETKVMDLGISKSLLYDLTRLTDPDTVIGSPPYMSPEQCSPGKPIDFRSDIYALGASLFHLVTNEFAFLGETAVDTLRMHLFGKLPDPAKFNPALSPACVDLIGKMMAKSPAGRHESWGELIAEIKACLGRE